MLVVRTVNKSRRRVLYFEVCGRLFSFSRILTHFTWILRAFQLANGSQPLRLPCIYFYILICFFLTSYTVTNTWFSPGPFGLLPTSHFSDICQVANKVCKSLHYCSGSLPRDLIAGVNLEWARALQSPYKSASRILSLSYSRLFLLLSPYDLKHWAGYVHSQTVSLHDSPCGGGLPARDWRLGILRSLRISPSLSER